MTFGKTVLVGTVVWLAGITGLYVVLNYTRHDETKFRVGFLPVT